MSTFRRTFLLFSIACCLILTCTPLFGQTVLDTVLVGVRPTAIAVNPATNMIYTVNEEDQTVSVLNGANDQVVATVPVGSDPQGLVVNPLTNRIYVVNSDPTVTLIDGSNNTPHTIPVGSYPWYIAINTVTNKIYVTNYGDNTVTAIDGTTNLTSTMPVRTGPGALAINTVNNRIYVCNWSENTVSVLDGASQTNIGTILVGHTPNNIVVNSTTNRIYVSSYTDSTLSIINGSTNQVIATLPLSDIPDVMAMNQVTDLLYVSTDDGKVAIVDGNNHVLGSVFVGYDLPAAIAVDPVTNKVYMPAGADQLVMLDGADNSVHNMTVGYDPTGIDINLGSNRVYVTNYNDNTVSIALGAPAPPLQWYSMPPCRLADTRTPGGPGPLLPHMSRTFFVPQLGGCGVPSTAAAYSLNVTVIPNGSLNYLTIWPTGEPQPLVSTLNSYDGRVKANAAIVPAGFSGGIDVYVTNATHAVLDIDGYFAPPSLNSYEFFPLPPCRVLDTRNPDGPLGGPRMEAGQARNFPVLQSSCLQGVNNPQAYSFNVSVVPNPAGRSLGYLTIWPADQQQPTVSTLNNPTATTVANGAIVPASVLDGNVKIFTSHSSDVFVDINGYFAAPDTGGLSMYPLAPCRVLDTRANHGLPFQGTLSPSINVGGSVCAPGSSAQAYIFNATVVPRGAMGYLTLWPHGEQQPLASTLNARDGYVTSNMAIVPNLDGDLNAYAAGLTHLIMDISGYFAPLPIGDAQASTPARPAHAKSGQFRHPAPWHSPR